MSGTRRPLLVGALAAAVIALVASGAVAVGALRGGVGPGGDGFLSGSHGFLSGSQRKAPKLPGTVVNVSLRNMGGPMMGGQGSTMMGRGGMALIADHATVPHGTVSFFVANDGSIDHEMVVLPLTDSQAVGTRPITGDGRVDEAGSLGEASKTNGEGAGEGIVAGASGWMTITLAPGHYELVCNLAGHYASGMFTELTVT
ncbi:MAG: hypothetical protein HHJ13_06650 [Phycicoccus sp.]|nr:hypothetical protein [Phycicoccus sp.]